MALFETSSLASTFAQPHLSSTRTLSLSPSFLCFQVFLSSSPKPQFRPLCSRMADSDCNNRPRILVPDVNFPIQPKPNKFLHTLRESLIVLFVLVFIILFPSQAPNFINQSILTKFWELLHLLFIGIAVSYGLFGRRNGNLHTETHPRIDNSPTYLSGLLHVSSFFEDGLENLCGSDEKKMIQIWNSQDFRGESVGLFTTGSSVLEKGENVRSPVLENGFGNSYMNGVKMASKAWNSQYFQGEPIVVVANRNDAVDQWGTADKGINCKPLGLPIRSLRSKILETNSPDSINRSVSGSSLKGSSKGDDGSSFKGSSKSDDRSSLEGSSKSDDGSSLKDFSKSDDGSSLKGSSKSDDGSSLKGSFKCDCGSSVKGPKNDAQVTNGKIRGMVPINLEKFKEAGEPSPIPWQSRLARKEKRKEATDVKPPLHSRPFTLDELEFEGFKARSFRHPIFCEVSSVSSSPAEDRHLHSSSSKPPNSNVEDLAKNKIPYKGSSPASQGGTLHPTSKIRGFSIGSASEINVSKSFKDDLKEEFCKSDREDSSGRINQGLNNLNSDVKPATVIKSLARAKSVRTIRSSERFMGEKEAEEIHPNRMDDKFEIKCKAEEPFTEDAGRRARPENPPVNTEKQNTANFGPIPNPTFFNYQNEGKQDSAASNAIKSNEDFESKFDDFQVSSDDEAAGFDIINDAASETSEVDRKAGEFIAKFREQIRLQKIASPRGHSGW